MLPVDELGPAIEIQSRSYRLLRWVADAVQTGFIPSTRAHSYANVADAAFDWMDQHYSNLPQDCRPEREELRPFANFFGTYITTSFDVIDQPGMQLKTPCGCYCQLCSHLVKAPHLRPKKLTKRDRTRARRLMIDRLIVKPKPIPDFLVDAKGS